VRCKGLAAKPEGRKSVGIIGNKYEDNIKIDIRDVEFEDVE
jgi:hypothetical protein